MRLVWLLILSIGPSTACVGNPPPPPSHDGGSSSGTGSSDATSVGPGTIPGDDTVGTVDGTGPGSTGGSTTAETTTGVEPTTSDGTTMGVDPATSGSSSGGPPPECMLPSDCDANETCNGMGQCVDACGGAWGAGSYGYCLTQYGTFDTTILCGGANHVCTWGGTPIEVATCSAQGCATACDCPPPPGTGNAVVTCDLLTVGDMTNDCFLDCSNGETCPDGMVCRASAMQSYCARPVQPLAMYGNCGAVAAPCANGGTCTTYSGYSVCVSTCPGGVGECDPTPPGSAFGPLCDTVISPPAGADCVIPCNGNPDCPPGMTCIDETGDLFCMWGP